MQPCSNFHKLCASYVLMRKQPAGDMDPICQAGLLQDAAALLVQAEDAPEARILCL